MVGLGSDEKSNGNKTEYEWRGRWKEVNLKKVKRKKPKGKHREQLKVEEGNSGYIHVCVNITVVKQNMWRIHHFTTHMYAADFQSWMGTEYN